MKSLIIRIDDIIWKELKELSGNSMGVYEFFKDHVKEYSRMASIVTFIENNLACHDGILFDSWSSYVSITFDYTDPIAVMRLDFDAKELKVDRMVAYKRWWKNVENTYPGILFHIVKHAQRSDVEKTMKQTTGPDKAFTATIKDKFDTLKDKKRSVQANRVSNMTVPDKVKVLADKRKVIQAGKIEASRIAGSESIPDKVQSLRDKRTTVRVQTLKNKRDAVHAGKADTVSKSGSGTPVRVINLKHKRNKKLIRDIYGKQEWER